MPAPPDLPDLHALAMLVITAVALVLFSIERLQLALTSLSLLTIISLIFALLPYPGVTPMMFFQGLAHEALIAVCALMTLGQGLVRTEKENGDVIFLPLILRDRVILGGKKKFLSVFQYLDNSRIINKNFYIEFKKIMKKF